MKIKTFIFTNLDPDKIDLEIHHWADLNNANIKTVSTCMFVGSSMYQASLIYTIGYDED